MTCWSCHLVFQFILSNFICTHTYKKSNELSHLFKSSSTFCQYQFSNCVCVNIVAFKLIRIFMTHMVLSNKNHKINTDLKNTNIPSYRKEKRLRTSNKLQCWQQYINTQNILQLNQLSIDSENLIIFFFNNFNCNLARMKCCFPNLRILM